MAVRDEDRPRPPSDERPAERRPPERRRFAGFDSPREVRRQLQAALFRARKKRRGT